MRTLMQFLPLLIFIFVVVSVVRNAAKVLRKANEQSRNRPPQPAGDYDPELAQRTRRIQEEIRRKIAERRGQVVVTESAPVEPRFEPSYEPSYEPPPEPPVIYAEERVDVQDSANTAAILERQEELAEQMRALEQARALEQRRAAQVTATLQTEAESERGLLVGTRGTLLAELRNSAGLRRAFVLREVLGTPVGLR